MGRKGAFVLLGLAGYLLVMAVMAKAYMYPRLAVVPLDQNTVTHAIGENMTYFDKGSLSEKVDTLTTTIHAVGDVKASQDEGHNVAVWQEGTNTTTSDGSVIAADTFKVGFDRTSGLAVDCCSPELNGEPNTFSGLIFKFPFNSQKKSYSFYDRDLREAVPFKYDGTATQGGITTYRYVQDIPPTKVGQISVPSRLVGAKPGTMASTEEWMSNHRVYYVEPETGVIIQADENPLTTLRYNGEDKITATKGTHVSFPADEVAANAKEYGDKGKQLHILRVYVPLVGLVLGLALGLLGVLRLLALRRKSAPVEQADEREPATQS